MIINYTVQILSLQRYNERLYCHQTHWNEPYQAWTKCHKRHTNNSRYTETTRGHIDRMTLEIKIQNTWLCSVTIAQILQIIRKSSAKRKFTGSTAHFMEKRVYSQRHTHEGKTFILAKTRTESRRPVNPIITMQETPFSSSIASIKLSPEQDES